MVFAPINTDAPIYHWPKATVGLIAANLMSFAIIASGVLGEFHQVVARYGLTYGGGLRPWQWLTSSFVHFDFVHVLGNMMFLWGLGLVVEGKIGWKAFLTLYLGLGVTECAIEQVLSFGTRGVSAGASSIVFGLLAVALVWAPRNELEFGYWLPTMRWDTFELSIVLFAVLVLIGQGLVAWWLIASGSGMTLSAPIVHLLGAVLGFAYATVAVRRDWVDCEGWDLYSVLQGRHAQPTASDQFIPIMERDPGERPRPKVGQTKPLVDPERHAVLKKVRCIKRVRKLVAAGQAGEAYQLLRKTQHMLDDWHLPQRDHVALGEALQRASLWAEAIALWEEYIELQPGSADAIRLSAAGLLLEKQRRPHAALRVLEPIDRSTLHPRLERRRAAIERVAQQLIDSGLIEIDQNAWR